MIYSNNLKRRNFLKQITLAALCSSVYTDIATGKSNNKPNIILVMTDDQGWGQTGYYNHPILKTPNLDAMAANGLRFDRFYAGAPVCSPTRATVLTGRTNDRTGVYSHGYALRMQEKTLPQAMKKAGYATGHFGKWHLNGLRGPGVPILKEDTHHPGHFGFEEWLSVTNFFDMNPLMSRMGKIEDFKGDSSEIIVAEALKFIKRKKQEEKPFLAVIWYGTPHSPFVAFDKDIKDFADLSIKAQHHHGELVAMDRSIGRLRKGLRKLGIADNTLVWFNSDNGGLPRVGVDSVGGLRGKKGQIWEGGLRVPGIIEWPAGIKPRITNYPASTMDIFPTIANILGLPKDCMLKKIDGANIAPLFKKEIGKRKKPIPFHFKGNAVLVDNDHKIIKHKNKGYELYDLKNDPKEKENIYNKKPGIAKSLTNQIDKFIASVEKSEKGADYPEGKVAKNQPERRRWRDAPEYKPYLDEFIKRTTYKKYKGKRKR